MPEAVREETRPSETTQETAPEPRRGFLRQYELIDRVKAYDPHADVDMINRAYVYATKMHGEQMRLSGDPYYAHPIEVAGILTELRLDSASIVTALLHDVIEDTESTWTEIAEKFSPEVADLVDGVTKLGQVELNSERTKQAENLQKFILAISKDVRVLLVKLADRLHNMRTLQHHPKLEKRQRIARETLEIYAPLARRIGVNRFCSELEDLSFKHLNPAAYETITNRLASLRGERGDHVAQVTYELTELLEKEGVAARVYGREKSPYSIWRKLERKSVSFQELADIYAFRVIVEDEAETYRTLGVIHRRWRCMPERFRDFISVPKPNNYRSLHTTIIGPDQMRVELQIRTEEMEAVAEHGVAAHWRYKDNTYAFDADEAKRIGGDPLARLRPFVEILEHGGDPDEFLEHAKMEMFTDQVFTFTPRGKLVPLPAGAMPLDFAYAIHTDIGDTCVGCRINGRERPLSTVLDNGDVVEILRAGTPAPIDGWQELAITGRARSAIRRLVRSTERQEFLKIGRVIAEAVFRREGKDIKKVSFEDALQRLELADEDELYLELGRGRMTGAELMDAVFPGRKDSKRGKLRRRWLMREDRAQLYVRGKEKDLTPGVTLHFAQCCSPLPGDRIVGILQPEIGVEVHTIDCDRLAEYEDDKDRWVDLAWTPAAEQTTALSRVLVTVSHEPGVLAEIAQVVGENNGNITDVSTLRRSTDFFEMSLDVEVIDAKHLSHIIAALRASKSVVSAKRAQETKR